LLVPVLRRVLDGVQVPLRTGWGEDQNVPRGSASVEHLVLSAALPPPRRARASLSATSDQLTSADLRDGHDMLPARAHPLFAIKATTTTRLVRVN